MSKYAGIAVVAFLGMIYAGAARAGTIYIANDSTADSVGIASLASGGTASTVINFSGSGDPHQIVIGGDSQNLLFVANGNASTVNAYNISGASPTAASALTGLTSPLGLAVSGSDLFVATYGQGSPFISSKITEYSFDNSGNLNSTPLYTLALPDTTAGTTPAGAVALAISGNQLYVAEQAAGKIADYTIGSSSLTLNNSFGTSGTISVSNLDDGIAVSNGDLFVSNGSQISMYNATNGGSLKSNLVTSLFSPEYIAFNGTDLFVTNHGVNGSGVYTVGEYDVNFTTDTASTVNASFVNAGLTSPFGIAIQTTPLPASAVAISILLSLVGLAKLRASRRSGGSRIH